MSWNSDIWGVLDESGTNGAECNRKAVSRRRVAGAIRSLVNARDLQLKCARVMHETLLVLFTLTQAKLSSYILLILLNSLPPHIIHSQHLP